MRRILLKQLTALSTFITIANFCFAQSADRTEKLEMKVAASNDLISFNKIKSQKVLTMGERGRGIITSFLISKGIAGIQTLIDNRKKKYTTDYLFAIKDESFYDQISSGETGGPFDPTGLRFNGFEIARVLKGKDGLNDTAFIAKFSIDTTGEKINEILNNGIFRLKLDTFILRSAKVKVANHEKILNMDFEISFISSWISENGQINADVIVGKFIYSIRNAPIDKSDSSYKNYYENLPKKNPSCYGQSFLIPRSKGYFKNDETKRIEQCWGEGIFSIKVVVKESSKNVFVDKLIINSSDDILKIGKSSLQKKFEGSN